MRYILQGGLGQGPHMISFFIARRHNPNKNSVGTALAIINIGGILGGAFFQPIIGALVDLGWEGKIGAEGERLWPAEHLRLVLSIVLTCCTGICILIVIFLIPKDDINNVKNTAAADVITKNGNEAKQVEKQEQEAEKKKTVV